MINLSQESEYTFICAADDLPVGKSRRFAVKDVPVAVFHLEDGFYAIEDACSHQGASLAFGEIDGEAIVCPRHGAHFDIRTGRVLTLPAVRGVRCYPVKVEAGRLFIGNSAINSLPPELFRLP